MGDILGSVTSIFGGGQSSSTAPTAASMANPFGTQYPYYQQQLMDLFTNPNYLNNQPAYQFNLQQGEQAAMGSGAAKGALNSGNTLSSLSGYASGFASNTYYNEADILARLSGAYTGSPAAAGSLYQSGTQNYQSGLMQGIGGLFNMAGGFGGISKMFGGGGGGGGGSATDPYASSGGLDAWSQGVFGSGGGGASYDPYASSGGIDAWAQGVFGSGGSGG